ncbi:SEC14-like protein [Schistosoma japonicum]|uniref:SEC14-like protein n=1 Tax=Schistosoma japonicum TaxID=6182 RepID=A0A4Z2DA83_SCHJA|nr:SEC14-like protein 3 [Schistosoma japonicum]TNN13394.1 SEC14-like protein [Schistosoma japonicum]
MPLSKVSWFRGGNLNSRFYVLMWSVEYDSGLEESLTRDELSILNQFYERMLSCPLDICRSKRYLIRWLRARSWDIDEAEKMLYSHLKWRDIHKVDTLLDWYEVPDVIQKYFPGGFCGEDKEGFPLYCAPVGRFDPGGFMKATTQTEFIQSRIYFLEYIIQRVLYEKSKEHNKCIDQLTLILDVKHLSLKHMHPSWIPVFSEMLTIMEANYPEVLRICYVINAPPIFGTIFNFIKPLLSKLTQEKIHVLKSDYRPTLLQVIDPNRLPACYGGKITDPDGDPQCPSKISWGGVVPSSLYRKKLSDDKSSVSKQSTTSEEMKRLTDCGRNLTMVEVGPASRKDISIGMVTFGDKIKWWLSCETNDIAVGLFMKNCSTEGETAANDLSTSPESYFEIIPMKRVSSHEKIVQGNLVVEKPGVYIFALDNTYSWTKSKRLWYHLSVTTGSVIEENKNNCVTPTLLPVESLDCNLKQPHDTSINDVTVLPIPRENYYACRMETGGSMDLNVSILFRFLVQILILPRIKQHLT